MPPAASSLDRFTSLLRTVFGPLASLRITVVLFALASLLVWFGTLAQKGQGVWTAVDVYFYSWIAKVELKYLLEFGKIFFGTRPDATTDWWIPFPGGKLIGTLMTINMAAAYLIRLPQDVSAAIKLGRKQEGAAWGHVAKRFGVYLLHSGVMVLLIGEYVTREFAVEQQMRIVEGESSNYAFETRNAEVAFVDESNPEFDKVAVLPAKKLKAAAEAQAEATKLKLPLPPTRFSHPDLPVDVEVVAYFTNSRLTQLDKVLRVVIRDAVPQELLASQSPAGPDQAAMDAAELNDRFERAVATAPEDCPLVPFERELEGMTATHFRTPTGQQVLARVRDGLERWKQAQRATAGYGLKMVAEEVPEGNGVDEKQTIDLPAVYVNLFRKGTGDSLGIYLLTCAWDTALPPQTLPGTSSAAELRFTRHYKPYTLHLNKIHADKYTSSSLVSNYSSDVRLVDADQRQDRGVVIKMNEPLRHSGDAIFQSGMDERSRSTILQVVNNRGWLLPYISCVLVGVGMSWHFGVKLVGFVTKSGGRKVPVVRPAAGATPPAVRSALQRFGIPVGVVVAVFVGLAVAAFPRHPTDDRGIDLHALAGLPVVDHGRVKPLDTVARVALRQITHSEEWTDSNSKKRSAIQWYMDTTADPRRPNGVLSVHIIRIENDQVRALLKLPDREGYRYSIEEVFTSRQMKSFKTQYDKARGRRADEKNAVFSVYETQLLEVGDHLGTADQVLSGATPLLIPTGDNEKWLDAQAAKENVTETRAKARSDALGPLQEQLVTDAQTRVKAALRTAGVPAELTEETVTAMPKEQRDTVLAIIQQEEKRGRAALADAMANPDVQKKFKEAEDAHPEWAASDKWERVKTTYARGEQKAFDEAVADYRAMVEEKVSMTDRGKVGLELFLNQTALYYWCTGLYAAAGVAALVGFGLLLSAPAAGRLVRRGVFWALVATFVVHTITLLARMALMDRPLVFVTNLYSSAVFIGWGMVGLCLLLELSAPIGFGNLTGAVLGFATTIIAHNLAASKDTVEQMEAVLNTNFWLATHVSTVTLGYSATYVAGFLGVVYAVLYVLPEQWVLRKRLVMANGTTTDVGKILVSLLYAVVCFAALLSFVGTVLGGIWADQSWGRFWGWDPKENGAILIVLWNALILHARWCGLIKERGTAVLAVGGFVVTTWSWFGTNQLGVGLHAYGFSKQLVLLCDAVWAGSLFLVLVGMLPWQWVYRGSTPPLARRVG